MWRLKLKSAALGFLAGTMMFLVAAGQALAQTTNGTSYYVDKNNVGGPCSDTNPGTITQPFCTVTKALTLAGPGTTTYLRQGTYGAFTINKSGTASNLLSVVGYPGESVVIDAAKASSGIHLNQVQYVEVKNFEVKNAGGNYKAGIYVYSGGNNIIKDNLVHDNSNGSNWVYGIQTMNSSFNTIEGNTVYNNYLTGISAGAQSGIAATGNQILNNVSHHNTGSAGNSDGISVTGDHITANVVRGNTVYSNSDDGIDTWNSSGNTIEANVVYGHIGPGDSNGIKLGSGTTGGNNLVRFNVSYGNKRNGFDSNSSGGNIYYHNVAYNNGHYGFDDGARGSAQVGCPNTPRCYGTLLDNIGYNNGQANFSAGSQTKSSNYNLWFSDGKGAAVKYNYGSTLSNLPSFTSLSGGLDANSLAVSPRFVNAPGDDFHLLSDSPAIDAGDPSNVAGGLLCGTRVDIGRFEFCSTSSTPTPRPTSGSPTNTPTPMRTRTPTPTATRTPSPTPTSTRLPSEVPTVLPGDINRDGTVNALDYVLLFQSFAIKPGEQGFDVRADLTGDGVVNALDYVVLFENFGKKAP